MINDLFKPDKKDGELELLLEQAEGLAQEADALQCNVTRDLEKLKASLFLPIPALSAPPTVVRACLSAGGAASAPAPGWCAWRSRRRGRHGCHSCSSSRCVREGGKD